ncbi:hypothetical protein B0O99DRAFT_558419 [Bisporella sp. PMI_857]|nr:hypothetical protein B0O99DRAFT_558419 [Bisporella sp. PMI_857]
MWPFSARYPEYSPEHIDTKSYDYIVVGGGTAGCALASRLSDDLKTTVLVLERGPVSDTWLSRIPIVSANLFRPNSGAFSWKSEPMEYADERRGSVFVGEVLGGATRINSMLYTRGTAADYDSWANMGHADWSYNKVLPYFVKAETSLNQPKSAYRGSSGPWITKTFTYYEWLFNVCRVFIDAAQALGFVRIPDPNLPHVPADGLATHDVTVNEAKQRVSSFDAFLPLKVAVERQNNLAICTNAMVTRLAFSDVGGKHTCEKVLFKSNKSSLNKEFSVRANKEVIVCAGAISSPQILMLSGIGPKKHLEEHEIQVVQDLPGVGSHLTDHTGIPVVWEVPIRESLTSLANSPILKGTIELFKYIFRKTGLLSIPIQMLSLFVRSTSLNEDGSYLFAEPSDKDKGSTTPIAAELIPNIELMPLPANAMDVNMEEHNALYPKIGIFSIIATVVRPKSRGTVRLASSNPHDRPKVDFGFLSDPSDLIIARKAVRLSLKVGQAMKASGFSLQRNLCYPEEKQKIDIENGNTKEMDRFIRQKVRSTFHYACSCRMAPQHDKLSPGVVDDKLRVYGVRNLRVCDTSVFPEIISSHLQAPAVMIGERCADFIKNSV